MQAKSKRVFVLLYVVFSGFFTGVAAQEGRGGQAGAFLSLPVNARANGMGSAYTAVAADASAAWWNPAGLANIAQPQFLGMYSMMSMDRMHNFMALAAPLHSKHGIGISWVQFGVSDIDGRDFRGQPTGMFSNNEMAFTLSYAYRFHPNVSAGLTGKYVHHALASYRASGFALDVGIQAQFKARYFIGAMLQNVFGALNWNTQSALQEQMPKHFRFGVGVTPGDLPVLFTIDAVKMQNDARWKFYAGGEIWLFQRILAVRCGYAVDRFTAGASFAWKAIPFNFQLDYAFRNDVLQEGGVNQISFLMAF